ncbi:hypothetical protein EW026_g5994 [Hermanssonia centrifuga]|uniref:Uncharacterized protein n=1 Tax=Hermanssonia centrifuga TaxID=98765 RepID=A0A4S4KE39_9APHY|nr:hypothetical protein EW026_g5994 [Hermanssonia centrifuga]
MNAARDSLRGDELRSPTILEMFAIDRLWKELSWGEQPHKRTTSVHFIDIQLMSTYTLTVNVHSDDLARLKKAGYKLCIAKQVNGKYNVVWSGKEFIVKNTFRWDSEFQVFGSQTFEGGLLVESETEERDIKFGETCTLDEYGSMRPAHGNSNASGEFYVENNYGSMHIGVNARLGTQFSAIYLSDQPFYTGKADLTPVEKVLVWFDMRSQTGTMLVKAITDTIEVNFTGSAAPQTVKYASDPLTPGKGGWTRAEQIVLSSTYHIDTDTFSLEKPSMACLAKLAADLIESQKYPQPNNLAVSALAEFHEPGAAQQFAQYALEHQPDGVRTWEFTHSGHIVESKLKAQKDLQDDLAVRFLQDAYLGVLYSFQGSKYKRLSFEIHGRNSTPPGIAQDLRSTGTLQLVEYRNKDKARQAAKGITDMSGYALQYEATVVKDTGVTMLFWPKFATGDVAFDRNAIVDPLATALFGEDSEEGEPAKYPPRSPKTREAMMTLLKWLKD